MLHCKIANLFPSPSPQETIGAWKAETHLFSIVPPASNMCMTHPKIGVSDGEAVGSPHTANKDSTSAYTGVSYSSSLAWEAQKILLQRNLTHLTDVLLKERVYHSF